MPAGNKPPRRAAGAGGRSNQSSVHGTTPWRSPPDATGRRRRQAWQRRVQTSRPPNHHGDRTAPGG